MSIEELIESVKKRKSTPEEMRDLLIKAKVLDEDGNYHKDYFSKETIERNKKNLNSHNQ